MAQKAPVTEIYWEEAEADAESQNQQNESQNESETEEIEMKVYKDVGNGGRLMLAWKTRKKKNVSKNNSNIITGI